MAWHYARYIGKVAEAGKAEYPLPMFTNAALIRPGWILIDSNYTVVHAE